MSEDDTVQPRKGLRDHAEMIMQMTKLAKQVERRTGAEACVLICVFRDGDQLRFQDAGRFPTQPDHFYSIMQQAHSQGLLTEKPKKKMLRPS